MSVEIGQNFSHYHILEKLGEGGMGIVYKALDSSLKRNVALKFLPANLTEHISSRKRFIVEAQAASALDHPNICNIHEINETEDGQLYICMAYYDGESLRQKIKKDSFTFEESLNIFYHLAHGLKAAHEEKIVHRDIKPGNIIITDKGEVKIVDFGLAKLAGEKLTESISTKGTIAYMAPEVIRNLPEDHRVDLWSLGVVLYEMLTGHLPFSGEYPEPLMYSILNEEPKSLSKYLNNVPEVLQDIIDKLLEKDPNERYQNLSDLLVNLTSFVKEDDSIMMKTKPAIVKLLLRKKAYFYGSISILLVILLLTIGRSYVFPDRREGNFIAVLPLKNISNDVEQEWFAEGMTDALITDLAQISGLRVISSSTAMKYKGTNKTPPEIAAELSVQYLVELSSVKMGEQLKISARLISASDDEYIWAKNYDHSLAEVLVLFSEAAQDIASEIKTELTLEDRKQFVNVRPVNPKAYELYLKGNYHLNNTDLAARVTAADYFKKAIELDSTFAPAYVGLGVCYGFFTYYGKVLREDGIAKIKNFTKKALEIDENLAEAYYNQGAFRLWQLWDWASSGKAFNRAISLNPNVLGILKAEYPWYLIAMGRFKDAIVEAERLLERDPLSPVARRVAAQAYFYARQ
jgi:serine/threonine protein kinase